MKEDREDPSESLLWSSSRDNYGDDDQSANMTSIPFERYEDEFRELTKQVKKCLDESDVENKSTNSSLGMAFNLLSQCDDLIKQMSVEARSHSKEKKDSFLKQVRVCKAQLDNLRDDTKVCQVQWDRSQLIRDPKSANNSSNAHRERLLQTNSSLQSQNDTLDRAKRIMAETEETALEITSELGRNRETISSAHSRVRDVSGLTNQARRIVQNMSRREVQQKLAIYVVCFILLVVLIIMINYM
eukprot:CAMPEP_0197831564 /NCGR_PEP_ID=MMETSP1437-20131217/10767_1 /TAXON_ID=49252 ORGANISM="Eucampia antarctica, Strain CCMP1452" /NCGR_SAMPLE_ID=MMETSP1437 /ASSEMBLY_ACC=CAM_ASM_001096 /LENGTH=242 /DNA_ID=CAMNT_0043434533 /DNA_START=84 /DNA_END=812 /DNA_ORIENTATION=+